MKLGREMDYHGSRNYRADVSDLSWSKLLLDWLVGIAKARRSARQPKSMAASRPEESRFTLLGVSSRVSLRTTANPFPLAPGKNDNGRGALRLRNEN